MLWLAWALLAALLPAVQCQACSDSTDIIYVIDASASGSDVTNNWRILLEFLRVVTLNIGQSAPGARFAFIRYGYYADVIFYLRQYSRYQDAADALLQISLTSQGVNLYEGLRLVETVVNDGRQSGGRRTTQVLIVADSATDRNAGQEEYAATLIKNLGVQIKALALTSSSDIGLLRRLVFDPNNGIIAAPTYFSLNSLNAAMVNFLCPATGSQVICNQDADVVLVLDSSGSMTEGNLNGWTLLKEFANKLASNLASISGRNYRFAVVKFSEVAIIEAYLQPYSQSFSEKLLSLTHMGYMTNHADALRKARSLISVQDDRADYIVIITDGVANVEIDEETRIAQEIRNTKTSILAVGVTKAINKEKLNEIAGSPERVIVAEDFQSDLVSQLVNMISSLQSCPGSSASLTPSPQAPAQCEGPPEVVYIVDASDSIDLKRLRGWEIIKDFISRLANEIYQQRPNSRFALVTFGSNATIVRELTGNMIDFQNAVRNARYIGGMTNQADGLRKGRTVLANVRQPSTKYVIMMTDGTPTADVGQETNIAKLLRDAGTRLIIVGVTEHRTVSNLYELAGPDGYVFQSDTYGGLTEIVASVIAATNVCPPAIVPCNRAYVVFALDKSESIEIKGQGNFERLQNFTIDLARGLTQRYPETQLALVGFSAEATIHRYFSEYKTLAEFEMAVRSLTYHDEKTNIRDALQMSLQVIVTGATSPAQVLLVTDGETTMYKGEELAVAKRMRDLGIQIVALGVTSEIDRGNLEDITGDAKRVFLSPDFQSLTPLVEPLIITSCGDSGQAIVPPDQCLPADIIFVLDASGSVRYTDWRSAKALVSDTMNYFSNSYKDMRFGIVVFSSSAYVASRLTSDRDVSISRLNDILYIGQETNIKEALYITRTQAMTDSVSDRRNVIVLISDGEANQMPLKEIDEARLLKSPPYLATISAVGITDQVSFDVLRQVASRDDLVVAAPNFETLRASLEQVISAVCISQDAPVFDIVSCKVDLVLVVDASSSITELANDPYNANWELVKQTLVSIIDRLGVIGPNNAQVALITFSDEANVNFHLKDSTNPQGLLDKIEQIEPAGYLTNIADALQVARMDVLDIGKGSRPDATQVVVLISDGRPTLRTGDTIIQAEQLKRKAHRVEVVAVSQNIDGNTLRLIANPGMYTQVKDYYELLRSVEQITSRICSV